MNNNFDNEKQDYNNIEIPEELNFKVKAALKKEKNQCRKRIIYNVGKSVAALFIIFITTVNVSVAAKDFFSSIPGFKELVELVDFNGGDDGFDNAIDGGLVQEVGYVSTKEGITLKVNSISGDYKNLWISYEVSNKEDYSIQLDVENLIGWSTQKEYSEKEGDYFSLSLSQYVENLDLSFKVYKKSDGRLEEKNYITTFKVPITLQEKFILEEKEQDIKGNIIQTSVGEITFEKLLSTKTRTTLLYKINSEDYKYIGFVNGVLVDKNGKEYKTDTSYISHDGVEYFAIEFRGEFPLEKEVTFKYDSLYLQRKEDLILKVNTKNKLLEDNPCGFELEEVTASFIKISNKNLLNCGVIHSESEEGLGINSTTKEEGKDLELNIENTGEEIIDIKIYDFVIPEKNEIKLNIQ